MKGSSIKALMRIPKFKRLFREAASLDIGEGDFRRYEELIAHKEAHGSPVTWQAHAKANGCNVIEPFGMLITKGLHGNMHAYRDINEDIGLERILEQMTPVPQLERAYNDDMHAQLPEVAGNPGVAVPHSLKRVEPDRNNPAPERLGRAFRLFDELV